MHAADLRQEYLAFFSARGHSKITRSNLVPREDPTTLFTGSGMQPLVPYLLGSPHPQGPRLVDAQPCFRAEDLDEVGDDRHTTFFEMLGNWSLGDYFKEQQLPWLFEFLIEVVGLDPNRLYVTAFGGSEDLGIPRDMDSVRIWGELFAGARVRAPVVELRNSHLAGVRGVGEARIALYDESQCWWSRSGLPANMPLGEPGGPDSEVFFLFPQVEHDKALAEHCHPHCDCGRFVEIGNSVFMQYRRTAMGFEDLPQPNVDFGGGLERLTMAAIDAPEVFAVDLLAPIVDTVREMAHHAGPDRRALRIVADHARAVTFLALDGVEPSNNTQGYVMRRFARRALRQGLHLGVESELLAKLVDVVADIYSGAYPELAQDAERVRNVLGREEDLFRRTLARGVRELPKLARGGLDGTTVFTLFDTYGFPPELSVEEAVASGIVVDPGWPTDYERLMAIQRERSRTAAAGLFKGGLADQTEATTRLHTATHLLYKALRLVLGDHVVQRGSNVTAERLRFDFSHPAKVTPEEMARVEAIVNENIVRDWRMVVSEMTPEQAFARGALGAFGDKYGATVTVYTAGDPNGSWYSKEICGGPHVDRTGKLGRFKIVKEESSSAGVRRVRAILE